MPIFLLCAFLLALPGWAAAQIYTFTGGSDGGNPQGNLVLSGNTLYGTTIQGGNPDTANGYTGDGTAFAVNTDGTGFTNLYGFTALSNSSPYPYPNSGGANPYAGVILSGNTLYGTAEVGGSSGAGTVFAINTDGTGFTNLYAFSGGSDGGYPEAGLVLSGSTLYGTTYADGTSADGTVFAVNTDGTGFTNLYSFTNGIDGANPQASLILSGNILYGTTYGSGDGASPNGTVFAVNTDGTGFTNLHSFTTEDYVNGILVNSDGANPQASLILSGNTLYGTAEVGGSGGDGTVFAINTDGTGFTNLYSFTSLGGYEPNTDGAYPEAGLVLSDNTLYGTAENGGSSGAGTVFAINTDGTGFTNLYAFTGGSDGGYPEAGLILSSNFLYGTTAGGGSSGAGTVFALSLPGAVVSSILFSFTVNAGTVTITGYTGFGGAVTIPTTINNVLNGPPVNSIGEGAFSNRTSLISVTFPNSVTSIGDYAFASCSNLVSAPITSSITNIGRGAFADTGLTNVTIPNSVTTIADYAFQGCTSLKTVTITNSVTSIGQHAFGNCTGLTNITIPNSVTNIADYAFQSCTGLTSVYFQGNAPSADATVFSGDNATIYYSYGTTGWSNPFAGLPTVELITYVLGTTNLVLRPVAGTNSVALGVFPSSGTWTATANAGWLHLSAGTQSGTGSTNVVFTYDANPGVTRFGTLIIGGLTLNLTQIGLLGTTNLVTGPAAGTNSVVLGGANFGAWTATTNAGWLHLSAGTQSGTGSTNVVFSYDANPGATRVGTLTLAGLTFTITQAGSTYVAAGTPTTLVSSGLSIPSGLAVDGAGNVYIADQYNQAIKKWTATNNSVTTLVSSGLNFPFGVAVDPADNVYIADAGNNAIKEWTAANSNVTTLVSSGLSNPTGVAVDGAGNVYIADRENNLVKEWMAASNTITTLVSSGLSYPASVSVDNAGNVYIADSLNGQLKEWTAANSNVTTLVSGLPYFLGEAVDGGGNDFIACYNNSLLEEWTAANNTVANLGSFSLPAGVAVDPAGNVYLAVAGQNSIVELPHVFVDPTARAESGAAVSDSLPVVLPATANLSGPFAPASDQSWLTISGITNRIVSFSLVANTGSIRTAHITLLGQTIPITQAVAVVGTPPVLTGLQMLGNGVLQFAFTNNPAASFTVLTTTNLSLPLANWTVAGNPTNTGSGLFLFTTQPTPNNPHRFYRVSSP
jgi:uncharacterized repeat protein (TIGR03803 family)